MFKPKITISKELYEKIKAASEHEMCSSVDEWAVKILEQEAMKILTAAGKTDISAAEIDDITKKLQGLGYLE
jgi:hypothetical protein